MKTRRPGSRKPRRVAENSSPDAPADPRDLVALGVPFRDAIRTALTDRGETMESVEAGAGLKGSHCSDVVTGATPYPYRPHRAALAAALDVPREWIDEHADEAIRRRWGRVPGDRG